MKIKILDAFGTQRGTASVEWLPVSYLETGPDGPNTPDEETALIFEPSLNVALPTKNPQVPWQLEIEI